MPATFRDPRPDDYTPSTITRVYSASNQLLASSLPATRVVGYDDINPLLRQRSSRPKMRTSIDMSASISAHQRRRVTDIVRAPRGGEHY
jgi:hypothetical protein